MPHAASTRLNRQIRRAFLPSILIITSGSVFSEVDDTDSGYTFDTIEVSTSVLKVDTPAQETPKSLSVVNQEDLVTHAPQKLDEALRYTSGVLSQPYGADNDTDWFKVRGFDAATYLDGSRLFRDGYYTWLLEPYGLEKIEVLKGPSSILYGEAPPGGLVNAVQKKPTDVPQKELQLEVGNNNYHAVTFDISDSLQSGNKAKYRVVGAFKENDGQLNGTENTRYYLAPSVSLTLSEQTRLTILATFLEDDGTPTNPFFPAAGTIISSPNGVVSPSTNLGEPDYDQYQRKQASLGYILEHDVNDTWTLSQKLNYGYNDLYLRSSYAFPNADVNTTSIGRGIVFRDGTNESLTFDNKAVAEWSSEQVENTLLIGLDLQRHKTHGAEQDNYNLGNINPYNPVYGNYNPLNSANNIDRNIEKSQASLYAQYQIKLDQQWIGLIGGRYDDIKTTNHNKTSNKEESRSDGEFSTNAGVMFIADNGLSPYLNYAESFDVLTTIDTTTNQLYKPLTGKQVELGLKYTPDTIDGYINLALFDLTQKNALITQNNVTTQAGEVTSQGIEIEGTAAMTSNTKLSLAYTYTDAQTDATTDNKKKQAGIIPKHMASAWLDINGSAFGIPAWSFGSGVRYIGESKDNPKNSDLTVPSATLLDMMASYTISDKWSAQLNINNALDKEYISACDYYCYYGQSRSIVLSTKYRW